MSSLIAAFNLACGHAPPAQEETLARRTQLALMAFAAALPMAALWGLAAGSSVSTLAAANMYKVPLVVLLATLGAAPPALVAWKLIVPGQYRARELFHTYALSVFFGAAVLLALAPIVALYYHSSVWGGPIAALASIALAFLCGGYTFVRRVRASGVGPKVAIPATVLALVFATTVLQLTAVFAPILPEHTMFREGIDAAQH